MKSFYRIILGKKNAHFAKARQEGFVGVDFGFDIDLSRELTEEWQDFDKKFIPEYLAHYPEKTKVSAGLACSMLWTVAKGIKTDDIVICPDGAGNYAFGEVTGEYQFVPGENLPHRRSVSWYPQSIDKSAFTQEIRNSIGSIATVCEVTKHAPQLEKLLTGQDLTVITTTDETVEDPAEFALETHLEEFLVKNWRHTELGRKYDIFAEDGEPIGQQYPVDTGSIDILAISKDKKELLIVELKRGRVSDVVVGQILRYMGFVKVRAGLSQPNSKRRNHRPRRRSQTAPCTLYGRASRVSYLQSEV